MKIQTIEQFYQRLPEDEFIMVDVLRGIVRDSLPSYCKEKISFNVPFFYGNKGICIIWPASIPRGGIDAGVLLGFWQGPQLQDNDQYLTKGRNKKVFYRIYESVEDIELKHLEKLLSEAVRIDRRFK